jgi:Lar family restriction alleviation protein
MSAEELLPCPFCGAAASVKTRLRAFVSCDVCGSHGESFCMIDEGFDAASNQAIAAWNRRTPIKPSADTGELRERVAEMAWRFRGNERLGGPWYPSAKPTDSPAMSDCFGFADAILDLIQSERAG